jgi:hypothetical protein
VNRTFEELALLRDIQEVWGVLGPQLFAFMNNSVNVAMLQVYILGWRFSTWEEVGGVHSEPGLEVRSRTQGKKGR